MNTTEALKVASAELDALDTLLDDAKRAFHNSQQWSEDGPTFDGTGPTYDELIAEGFNKVRSALAALSASAEQQPYAWVVYSNIYPRKVIFATEPNAERKIAELGTGTGWSAYEITPLYTFAPQASQPHMSKDVEWIAEAADMSRSAPMLATNIRNACKAQASQPVALTDEREAFEKEANSARFFPAEISFRRTKSPSGRDEYENSHLQSRWEGWKGRALLSATSQPSAWYAELIEALSHQKQCDEDGIMCIVSRQAVDGAIRALRQQAPAVQEEADIALLREADDFAQFSDLPKTVREVLRRVIASHPAPAQTAPVVPSELPPLPAPAGTMEMNWGTPYAKDIDAYTEDQMRGYAIDARLSAAPSAPIAANSEDAKDAARYRWLRERFIGYDFYFGGDPMAEKEEDRGVITINFEIPKSFNAGRDIDTPIDAAIAATAQQKKEGE